MKLSDLLPDATPELIATYEIKIAVNWATQKAKLAIVGYDNILIAERELKATAAPDERVFKSGAQGEYWQRHHNPWLD